MLLDTFLIAQAKALSSYIDFERVNQMAKNYRAAYQFAVDSGADYDVAIFHDVQAKLRRYVHSKRNILKISAVKLISPKTGI